MVVRFVALFLLLVCILPSETEARFLRRVGRFLFGRRPVRVRQWRPQHHHANWRPHHWQPHWRPQNHGHYRGRHGGHHGHGGHAGNFPPGVIIDPSVDNFGRPIGDRAISNALNPNVLGGLPIDVNALQTAPLVSSLGGTPVQATQTPSTGQVFPPIAEDGSYVSFMQKLHRLDCQSRFDSSVWHTLNDPSDPKLAQFSRTPQVLPGAHKIMNWLETFRKEGILPQDVSITVHEQNVVNQRKTIEKEVQGDRTQINIYADNPGTIDNMRTFFQNLGVTPKAPKLSDEAWNTKKLQCDVFFASGIHGGISEDGNIAKDLPRKNKILNVLKDFTAKGWRVRSPTQFFYFTDTVKTPSFFDPGKRTLLINPDFTAEDLKPFFFKI